MAEGLLHTAAVCFFNQWLFSTFRLTEDFQLLHAVEHCFCKDKAPTFPRSQVDCTHPDSSVYPSHNRYHRSHALITPQRLDPVFGGALSGLLCAGLKSSNLCI